MWKKRCNFIAFYNRTKNYILLKSPFLNKNIRKSIKMKKEWMKNEGKINKKKRLSALELQCIVGSRILDFQWFWWIVCCFEFSIFCNILNVQLWSNFFSYANSPVQKSFSSWKINNIFLWKRQKKKREKSTFYHLLRLWAQ